MVNTYNMKSSFVFHFTSFFQFLPKEIKSFSFPKLLFSFVISTLSLKRFSMSLTTSQNVVCDGWLCGNTSAGWSSSYDMEGKSGSASTLSSSCHLSSSVCVRERGSESETPGLLAFMKAEGAMLLLLFNWCAQFRTKKCDAFPFWVSSVWFLFSPPLHVLIFVSYLTCLRNWTSVYCFLFNMVLYFSSLSKQSVVDVIDAVCVFFLFSESYFLSGRCACLS